MNLRSCELANLVCICLSRSVYQFNGCCAASKEAGYRTRELASLNGGTLMFLRLWTCDHTRPFGEGRCGGRPDAFVVGAMRARLQDAVNESQSSKYSTIASKLLCGRGTPHAVCLVVHPKQNPPS